MSHASSPRRRPRPLSPSPARAASTSARQGRLCLRRPRSMDDPSPPRSSPARAAAMETGSAAAAVVSFALASSSSPARKKKPISTNRVPLRECQRPSPPHLPTPPVYAAATATATAEGGCEPVRKACPVTMEHVLLALHETEAEREAQIRDMFGFFDTSGRGLAALQVPAECKYGGELLRACDHDGRVGYEDFRRYMDDPVRL